jgi:predicted SAM-dependent methyltransferase
MNARESSRDGRRMAPVKLNLGCGDLVRDGWLNVDYAVGARIAKVPLFRALNRRFHFFNLDWDDRIYIHDLTRPFPWKAGSVDIVYTSHLLEHLSRDEGHEFLRQCHRVLRGGGVIRIVVPDLAWFIREYKERRLPSEYLLERMDVLYTRHRSSLKNILSPFIQFPHQCMYDAEALLKAGRDAGFDVAEKKPFQSSIPDIEKIEMVSRTENAVIVEGVKVG